MGFVDQLLYILDQISEIFLNDSPDDLVVNAIVAVYQNISE